MYPWYRVGVRGGRVGPGEAGRSNSVSRDTPAGGTARLRRGDA